MKVTVLVIAACLAFVYGNNDKINDGASTSGSSGSGSSGSSSAGSTPPRFSDVCEYCNLESYARRLVFLMLGEEINGVSVAEMMETRYHELEVFYDDILNCIFQGSRSTRGNTPVTPAEVEMKLEYFSFMVNQILYEFLETTQSRHRNPRIWYEYMQVSDTMLLMREETNAPMTCTICENNRPRPNIFGPVPVPFARHPERRIDTVQNLAGTAQEEMTMYHIIPLPLISRFFRVWMAMEPGQYTFASDCLIEFYSRMKRAMQKVLVVSIRKSQVYTDTPAPHSISDLTSLAESFSVEGLQQASSWLTGNIFIGPSLRGPFSPDFEVLGEDLLRTFEYDAQHLLAPAHYQGLLSLYHRIHNFINQAWSMRAFNRLQEGFNILTTMISLMGQYPITPFNLDRWVLRAVRPGDLDHSTDWEIEALKHFRFWKPSGPPNYPRLRRSISKQKVVPAGQVLKNHWRRFVNNVMKVSLQAHEDNDTLSWQQNYTYLLDEYRFREVNYDTCINCLSFDEFLYRKIAKSWDWQRCNNNTKLDRVNGWCQSWRHVIILHGEKDPSDPYNVETPKWKYLDDMEVIMAWLTEKWQEVPKKVKKPTAQTEEPVPLNLVELLAENSPSDIAMCLLTTFVGTSWRHSCNKLGL